MGTPEPSDPGEPSRVLSHASVLRTFLVCAAGSMFAGMAVWILVLDPQPAAAPWTGWRVRDAALALAAAMCLRGLAQAVWGLVLLGREERGGAPVPELTRNLGAGAWQTLACVVAVGAFALGPYRLDIDALGLTPVEGRWLAVGALVGFVAGPGAILGFAVFCRAVGHRPQIQSRQLEFLAPTGPGQVRPWAAVAGMVLVGAVLAPVGEELLFRGVVYPGLRNELGPWVAVPLSAALFGLAHYELGWAPVAFTGLMGVAFALLVEAGGSLGPAVVAHVLINTKVVAAFLPWFRGAP
jgi:membrane protease YdiL (CAAX protease family)